MLASSAAWVCRPALAWPIILAEFLGGVAILVGFHSRVVSLALIPILLGALAIHAPNGWVFNAPNGGWEYPAFLALTALAQALIGEGAFAVKPTELASAATHRAVCLIVTRRRQRRPVSLPAIPCSRWPWPTR